jgi:hypothetical protein
VTQPSSRAWVSIALVILLVALLGVGAFLIWKLSTRSASSANPAPAPSARVKGTLVVTSIPPDCLVYVNGRPYGTTPTRIQDLPLDEELTVRVKKDGYQDYLQPVKLTSGQATADIEAKLSKP